MAGFRRSARESVQVTTQGHSGLQVCLLHATRHTQVEHFDSKGGVVFKGRMFLMSHLATISDRVGSVAVLSRLPLQKLMGNCENTEDWI